MACTAGRLRATRYSALQALAAVETSLPSAFPSIIGPAAEIRCRAWVSSSWLAAPSLSTSAALYDRGGADDQRSAGSIHRRSRQDDRTHGLAQDQRPQSGQPRSPPRKDGGDERSRGTVSRTRDRDIGQPRSDAGRGLPDRVPDRAAGGPPGLQGVDRPAQRVNTPAGSLQHRGDSAAPKPPPLAHQRWPAVRRWDLAARNAPQRVVNLIGDPRTGIADDTTTNPFGEVTVDMIHHQPNNEVYWFKYDFAGGQLHGAHRDARLSDYTRNLMYLLRAKDPKRWTVQALAEKFRIRKQRVLAILALKELEAQRIEDGRLLTGPLSSYALTVHIDDVYLDPVTGAPRRSPPAAAAPKKEVSASSTTASGAAAGQFHVDSMLPQVLSAAQQLQAQWIQILKEHAYDPAAIRQALLADLRLAADLAARVFGTGGAGSGDDAGPAATIGAVPYLAEEMQAYRAALEAVVAAVDDVVSASPPLLEERRVAAFQVEVESALAAASQEVSKEALGLPMSYATGARAGADFTANAAVRAGAAAAPRADAGTASSSDPAAGTGAVPSAGLQELQLAVSVVLEPVMKTCDDGELLRLFFSLPPGSRGLLLRLLPELSIRLNAAGVDLVRATKKAPHSTPAGPASSAAEAEAAGGSLQRLPVDVFAFLPVPDQRLETLTAAVELLGEAQAALTAKIEALDPAAANVRKSAAVSSVADMKLARSFVRRYVAADAMWAELLVPQSTGESRAHQGATDPVKKRRMLEVLAEADPGAVTRALQVEAAMQLRTRRAFAEADALMAGVGAAAAAAGASQGAVPPARPGDRASWDALAAYLDVKVAGKVYSMGSGERHVTRLPSFPAFEGYSLEEFDQANESELSSLNRKVAERTDAEMFGRFQIDLLYNLGLRGEKLRDSTAGQLPWPANLRTELQRPVVVYGISADDATQYPPLYVATADGKKRPLNEQEQVFQERRAARPRLPYYMGRIRRMPELV